jgi:hypothetical protein
MITFCKPNASIGACFWAQVKDDQMHFLRLSESESRPAADRPTKRGDDLVITPGGPRPRDKVHRVEPGEALWQNQDGTFTIVPKSTPTGSRTPRATPKVK